MPRKFEGDIDQPLLRQYLLPALRDLSLRLKFPLSPADGQPWPGRAKVAELAADHIEDLLGRIGEMRTEALRQKYAARYDGRRRLPAVDVAPDEADEWLAAMERDMDTQAEIAAVAKNELNAHGYNCKECGFEIKVGDSVGANSRGIIHAECADGAKQYDY
jgi:hypothetical protein